MHCIITIVLYTETDDCVKLATVISFTKLTTLVTLNTLRQNFPSPEFRTKFQTNVHFTKFLANTMKDKSKIA